MGKFPPTPTVPPDGGESESKPMSPKRLSRGEAEEEEAVEICGPLGRGWARGGGETAPWGGGGGGSLIRAGCCGGSVEAGVTEVTGVMEVTEVGEAG